MKNRIASLSALILTFMATTSNAQFGAQGGGSQGVRFNGAMAKIFGDQANFSASVNMEMQGGALADAVTMPGKLAVADNNSRFEMDATQIKSARMPESAVAQMKSMGMDKMIMISRPDKKASYVVYPNLQSHAETPMTASEAAERSADFKIETTNLGKETVDGHPCWKIKVVLTDSKGTKQEATVWRASDLKEFPVKLQRTENGSLVTMTFKDVKLGKPEAKMFEPPSGSTRYDSMQAMMQDVMSKKFGGAGKPGQ